MKLLKKDLLAVVKTLKQLTRQTEQMMKRLDKLEKGRSVKKSQVKAKPAKKAAGKKAGKTSAIDTILNLIVKRKRGIDVATLKKKTGFQGRKIYDNVHRLKKLGKIKGAGKGVYVKA